MLIMVISNEFVCCVYVTYLYKKMKSGQNISKKAKIDNKGQSVINDKADETEHQQQMNLQ